MFRFSNLIFHVSLIALVIKNMTEFADQYSSTARFSFLWVLLTQIT